MERESISNRLGFGLLLRTTIRPTRTRGYFAPIRDQRYDKALCDLGGRTRTVRYRLSDSPQDLLAAIIQNLMDVDDTVVAPGTVSVRTVSLSLSSTGLEY